MALRQKNFSEAIRLAEEVLESDESSAGACLIMGTALLMTDQFDRALPFFQKACDIEPENAGVWFNLGEAQRAAGLPQKATASYEKALTLQPGNAILPFKILVAKLEAGNNLKEITDASIKKEQPLLYLAGGAAEALLKKRPEVTKANLEELRISIPKELFAAIIADPVFLPYRDTPELSAFFPILE